MDEKPSTPEARAHLARTIKERRYELDLTQTQVASAGGPSVSLISKIEGGKPGSYDEMSILRLERALQWRPGSIDAVLNGYPPTPVDDQHSGESASPTTPTKPPERISGNSTQNDQIAAHLVERMAIMQQQQNEMIEELRGLRRQIDDLHRGREQQGYGESANRDTA